MLKAGRSGRVYVRHRSSLDERVGMGEVRRVDDLGHVVDEQLTERHAIGSFSDVVAAVATVAPPHFRAVGYDDLRVAKRLGPSGCHSHVQEFDAVDLPGKALEVLQRGVLDVARDEVVPFGIELVVLGGPLVVDRRVLLALRTFGEGEELGE